ncbi:hypothetical protein PILCRDRAFT_697965 [Piloderma croceum F 1598]|uniref:Uncharacterized protein n=1 Tax=Piloderma croceum (strain F 1598) TaxID=765440 RepID=A0A0C3EQ22_PILCF|nr:hypothetical protein PILCRDRAFT_697965 [Piloderma croceum F 1598]
MGPLSPSNTDTPTWKTTALLNANTDIENIIKSFYPPMVTNGTIHIPNVVSPCTEYASPPERTGTCMCFKNLQNLIQIMESPHTGDCNNAP